MHEAQTQLIDTKNWCQRFRWKEHFDMIYPTHLPITVFQNYQICSRIRMLLLFRC